MSFKSGIRSAGEEIFGEFLFQLPGALLDGCDDIGGFIFVAVVVLALCGLLVFFLGMVTMVSEAFSPSGLQQLGLK